MKSATVAALLIVFGWLVRTLLILGFYMALVLLVLAYAGGMFQ